MNTLEGIAQRRPFHRVVIFLRDASGTYLHLSILKLSTAESQLLWEQTVQTFSSLPTFHLSVLHFSVPSSQGLMRVKWDFILILALASNSLSVALFKISTEGFAVASDRVKQHERKKDEKSKWKKRGKAIGKGHTPAPCKHAPSSPKPTPKPVELKASQAVIGAQCLAIYGRVRRPCSGPVRKR